MTSTPSLPDSFTTTLSVDQSPNEVFAAVLNVRGWWSENIDGPTDQPGDLFTYHHQDVHRCTMRVAEMTRPTRVVWHVVDNHFNFTDDANEWKGTEIHFDITRVEAKPSCASRTSGSPPPTSASTFARARGTSTCRPASAA